MTLSHCVVALHLLYTVQCTSTTGESTSGASSGAYTPGETNVLGLPNESIIVDILCAYNLQYNYFSVNSV